MRRDIQSQFPNQNKIGKALRAVANKYLASQSADVDKVQKAIEASMDDVFRVEDHNQAPRHQDYSKVDQDSERVHLRDLISREDRDRLHINDQADQNKSKSAKRLRKKDSDAPSSDSSSEQKNKKKKTKQDDESESDSDDSSDDDETESEGGSDPSDSDEESDSSSSTSESSSNKKRKRTKRDKKWFDFKKDIKIQANDSDFKELIADKKVKLVVAAVFIWNGIHSIRNLKMIKVSKVKIPGRKDFNDFTVKRSKSGHYKVKQAKKTISRKRVVNTIHWVCEKVASLRPEELALTIFKGRIQRLRAKLGLHKGAFRLLAAKNLLKLYEKMDIATSFSANDFTSCTGAGTDTGKRLVFLLHELPEILTVLGTVSLPDCEVLRHYVIESYGAKLIQMEKLFTIIMNFVVTFFND